MYINPSLHQIESLEGVIGLDVETSGLNPWEDTIHSIAIATENRVFAIDVSAYDKEQLGESLKYMAARTRIVAHNAKFDIGFLYGFFGVLPKDVFCTFLASQIISNGNPFVRHNLVAVVHRYLNIDLMETDHKKLMRELYLQHRKGEPLSKSMLEYVVSDTKYLLPLMREQEKILKKEKLDVSMKVDNLLSPVLAKMEVDGCLVDDVGWHLLIDEWKEHQKELQVELDKELLRLSEYYPVLKQPFYTGDRNQVTRTQFDLFGNDDVEVLEGEHIQYASQSQVVDMLEAMEVDVPLKKMKPKDLEGKSSAYMDRLTKKGKVFYKKSLDEESLTEYINENPYTDMKKFFMLLLKQRQTTKLLSTYGEAFLDLLDANHHVHTRYTQCSTATGRLSSSGPNLQNIPPVVRGNFIPRKGHVFITSDMNSAEVCIAADYSKEQMLLDSQIHGEDLHSKLASKTFSIIFGCDVTIDKTQDVIKIGEHEFIKDDLRTAHKRVLFAKFYKGGAARIYTILSYYINLFHSGKSKMSVARQISTSIDKLMPKLTEFLSNLIEEANTKGELRGTKQINRRRYFDGDVYGEAANFPIQNTNAEAMKIALVNLFEYLEDTGLGRLVLTVHDEVVVETTPDVAEKVGTKVASIMSHALDIFLEDIEGGASINIGMHWKK